MQRLSRGPGRPRTDDDRGAVNVLVALLMVPLLGFAALAVDVAGMRWERLQLQTAADAAALALAQDCARGSCGNPTLTAGLLAEANLPGRGISTQVLTPGLQPASGSVTVRAASSREHVFAPVLGVDSSNLAATTSAVWGAPSGGTSQLPLMISWCDFAAQTGGGLPSGTTPRVIRLNATYTSGCRTPGSDLVPGGFRWVFSDPGRCEVTTEIGQRVIALPDPLFPPGCATADLRAVRNQTVLLPIYDRASTSSVNLWYQVYGYAAFTVTGYYFSPFHSWNNNGQCRVLERCLMGYFTRYVDTGDAFHHRPGAPDLGASVVRLTS